MAKKFCPIRDLFTLISRLSPFGYGYNEFPPVPDIRPVEAKLQEKDRLITQTEQLARELRRRGYHTPQSN